MTHNYILSVKELTPKKANPEPGPMRPVATQAFDLSNIADFELVIGTGEEQKTIATNKAMLACFLPAFEHLVEDMETAQKLVLEDLHPKAAETVLKIFTTREGGSVPHRRDPMFLSIGSAIKKFGLDDLRKRKASTEGNKGSQHPALTDNRWLDVTFLVGPYKEEVKANRAVLASLNPVLCRMLYGTGHISVDPAKPIEWPEYDAVAVRRVFDALVHLGKHEVVVPMESATSAKALVDYLMESVSDLNIYFDTPFKREIGDVFYLCATEDDNMLLEVDK